MQKCIFHILRTLIQTIHILTSLDEEVESFAGHADAHPVGQIDIVVEPLRARNDGVADDGVDEFHTLPRVTVVIYHLVQVVKNVHLIGAVVCVVIAESVILAQ